MLMLFHKGPGVPLHAAAAPAAGGAGGGPAAAAAARAAPRCVRHMLCKLVQSL
jgi:hypothetical protein